MNTSSIPNQGIYRKCPESPYISTAKDIESRKAAYVELQRSRVGRKTRIIGTVEEMLLVESDGLGQKPVRFAE